MPVLTELSLLLVLAVGMSLVARLLRQPLIVGYILTGILAGPQLLNIIQSPQEIELFSKIGIIFLLFIVGLHLNPKVIGEVGKASLITGIGQIAFTALIGFGIARWLGIERLASLYVAIALTFSSTIIILKLLSDKGDLDKLYAKISIGFLLVQDVVAILSLMVIGVSTQSGIQSVGSTVLWTVVKGLVLFALLISFTTKVLPRSSRFLARSTELLFLFSAAWALGLAGVFLSVGFSLEIGALVAGVTLAATEYADEMASRLKPIRDLFILIFFVSLGAQVTIGNLGQLLLPALILSVFVLVSHPVILYLLMNVLGYSRRTGFLAGLAVAQISEFSLIIAALGFQVGHLPQQVLSLITLVGLITIAGSTYLILYAESLYPKLKRMLRFLEIIKSTPSEGEKEVKQAGVILFGYGRSGEDFVKVFQKLGKPFLVVDFNPDSIEKLKKEGLPHRYGDASDAEFLEDLPLDEAKIVLSTIPEVATNRLIQARLNEVDSGAISILLAHEVPQAQELYEKGTTYVLMPHFLGGVYAARFIGKFGINRSAYEKARENHLKFLESRDSA